MIISPLRNSLKGLKKLIEKFTVVIKTFERQDSLVALLRSINKYHPTIKVLVVDDSRDSKKLSSLQKIHTRVEYYYVGYDLGLSYCRNFAISKVSTEFFFLFDDDFILTKKSNLFGAMKFIIENEFDIAALRLYDFGMCKRGYLGTYDLGPVLQKNIGIARSSINEFKMYDFVINCFVAKTESVKKVLWDPILKIGYEHDDFFIRGKDFNLKISEFSGSVIYHFPIQDRNYKVKRNDNLDSLLAYFLKKHKVEAVVTAGQTFSVSSKILLKLFSRVNFVFGFFVRNYR